MIKGIYKGNACEFKQVTKNLLKKLKGDKKPY